MEVQPLGCSLLGLIAWPWLELTLANGPPRRVVLVIHNPSQLARRSTTEAPNGTDNTEKFVWDQVRKGDVDAFGLAVVRARFPGRDEQATPSPLWVIAAAMAAGGLWPRG